MCVGGGVIDYNVLYDSGSYVITILIQCEFDPFKLSTRTIIKKIISMFEMTAVKPSYHLPARFNLIRHPVADE